MELHALGGEPGGEAALLLHGFGADRLSWIGTVPALADRALVLALDLPGHASASDASFVSFDALVGELAAALDADPRWQGATCRHLVGHSLGGALAVALVARAGRAPATLSLLAPLGLGRGIDSRWLRGFVALDDGTAAAEHLSRLVENPRLMPPQVGPMLVRQLERRGVRETLGRIVDEIERIDAVIETDIETVLRLDPPRLVIWGERDAIGPVAKEKLARFGGRHSILSGCGHLPHIERRVEVNDLLRTASCAPQP